MTQKTKATSPIRFSESKPLFNPVDYKYFDRVTPEECGIESRIITEFVTRLWENENVGLQGIMLMRGDKVFFEAEVGNQDFRYPKATFSQCKSIIALAIGILVTQGKLRLSEKITDIFADKLTPMAKIKLKGLSVKHLLTMTSRVTFNELEASVSSDWVKSFLNSDIDGDFGKTFKYNSLNSYMLASIISIRVGTNISEYLKENLFNHLDITDFYWEKCPNGTERGGWGLYLRREDLAKLGLLVLQNGVWNGKRLINGKYISDMTRMQVEVPFEYGDFNYGFHTWCGREKNSFLFNGMLGQNLLCYKHSGIMIIANCSNCDLFQQNDFFSLCNQYLSGNFDEKVEENPLETKKLDELKAKLKKPKEAKSFLSIKPNCRDFSEDIKNLNGKHFNVISENRVSVGIAPVFMQFIQCNFTEGLKEIYFEKNDDYLDIYFIEENQSNKISVGFSESKFSNITLGQEHFTLSSRGEFRENEDGIPLLKVYCDFIETPYSRCFKFYFNQKKITAVFDESPAYGLIKNQEAFNRLAGSIGSMAKGLFSKVDGDYIAVKLAKIFAPELILEETE